jgi:hypothetical protein
MPRVAGRVERHELQPNDFNNVAITQSVDLRGGDGEELAPHRPHPLAVDALRAREQFGGINQMRRADVVHVNARALLRPPARRARVVEMDVRHQHVAHVRGREAMAREFAFERGDSRAGAGLDDDRPAGADDEIGGNPFGAVLKAQVEGVNFKRRHGFPNPKKVVHRFA